MTLGSPTGSPAAGTSPYLPSFLMGDSNPPTTPRNNTLSPTKATSPGVGPTSPPDFNRSTLGQKTLFGYQQTPPTHNYPGTPIQSHNTSISGPPTQGLFDSLRDERHRVQTPTRQFQQNQCLPLGTPTLNHSLNESALNQSSFNASRLTSPIAGINPNDYRNGMNSSNPYQCPPQKHTEFWITVFGFPQSATGLILSHFSQCGTIMDKMFAPQNGNWVHLKFSSRLECDKALNYNEKILANNIMIGVTYCKDLSIVDKENLVDNTQVCRVRPLVQVAYKSAQCETAVVPSPSAPQRSSGIVNKAMDLLFGW